MPTKTTFHDFLLKHCPDANKYGNGKRYAEDCNVSQKQFGRWLSQVTTPCSEEAIRLLQKWGELKAP